MSKEPPLPQPSPPEEEREKSLPGPDKLIQGFFKHLSNLRGVSVYTQRNYKGALEQFHNWHSRERGCPPRWPQLGRDDFRAYLRFLGRQNLGRASIQLRFSALRTFYRFLMREGLVASSPVKSLSLPKQPKRLPKFITPQQTNELLKAPLQLVESTPDGKPRDAKAKLRGF